jgi:hypothetical protein
LIERTYRPVSQDEVALRIAEAQLAAQERNSLLLLRLTKDLSESLNAGLGRIETAASSAADVANQEQRLALESVTQDLAGQLQQRLGDQLSALRTSIELSASDPKGSSKSNGVDARAPAALERAAQAVEQAAAALERGAEASSSDRTNLGQVADVLEQAVEQIEEAQQEAGEEGVGADALAGLRDEVTQMHDQMVESVIAARESRTGETPVIPQPASGSAVEVEEVRTGTSALLHRYRAPRFSLDELDSDLRSFDADAAIERARSSSVAPDGSLVPRVRNQPVDSDEADEADEADEPAEHAPQPTANQQRLRLAQFLKQR